MRSHRADVHDRSLAAGVTIALVVGLATLPAHRASAGTAEPVDDRPVAGVDVPLPVSGAAAPTADPDAEAQQGWKPPAVTAPGNRGDGRRASRGVGTDTRDSAVGGSAGTRSGAATRVSVHVLDRASAARAGAPFLAFTLGPAAGGAGGGAVDLSVDYTGFRHGFGADYATRLRPVSYPACDGYQTYRRWRQARHLATAAEALAGSGPVPGVLEASGRVKSFAALRNYNPERGVKYVFDPATGTFAVGRPAATAGLKGVHTNNSHKPSARTRPLLFGGR